MLCASAPPPAISSVAPSLLLASTLRLAFLSSGFSPASLQLLSPSIPSSPLLSSFLPFSPLACGLQRARVHAPPETKLHPSPGSMLPPVAQYFDLDGSNTLDEKEIWRALDLFNIPLDRSRLRKLIAACDAECALSPARNRAYKRHLLYTSYLTFPSVPSPRSWFEPCILTPHLPASAALPTALSAATAMSTTTSSSTSSRATP